MTAKLYFTIKLNSGLPSGNCYFRKVRTVIVKMFFKQQQFSVTLEDFCFKLGLALAVHNQVTHLRGTVEDLDVFV